LEKEKLQVRKKKSRPKAAIYRIMVRLILSDMNFFDILASELLAVKRGMPEGFQESCKIFANCALFRGLY